MHYYRNGEQRRLYEYYIALSDKDLAYEYTQPDCLNCNNFYEKYGEFPEWCEECCTWREVQSPIDRAIDDRKLDVYRYFYKWIKEKGTIR